MRMYPIISGQAPLTCRESPPADHMVSAAGVCIASHPAHAPFLWREKNLKPKLYLDPVPEAACGKFTQLLPELAISFTGAGELQGSPVARIPGHLFDRLLVLNSRTVFIKGEQAPGGDSAYGTENKRVELAPKEIFTRRSAIRPWLV